MRPCGVGAGREDLIDLSPSRPSMSRSMDCVKGILRPSVSEAGLARRSARRESGVRCDLCTLLVDLPGRVRSTGRVDVAYQRAGGRVIPAAAAMNTHFSHMTAGCYPEPPVESARSFAREWPAHVRSFPLRSPNVRPCELLRWRILP